jgi:hypothetical protein
MPDLKVYNFREVYKTYWEQKYTMADTGFKVNECY